MAKSHEASRKSNTHFEQVPLEVVKKIAEQEVSKDKKAGTARSRVEPASRKKR
jgi:hypothetical protein